MGFRIFNRILILIYIILDTILLSHVLFKFPNCNFVNFYSSFSPFDMVVVDVIVVAVKVVVVACANMVVVVVVEVVIVISVECPDMVVVVVACFNMVVVVNVIVVAYAYTVVFVVKMMLLLCLLM